MLIDDHPIVREGLKRIICENLDMAVVAEASDGNEALHVITTTPCDAVLLDISFPRMSGVVAHMSRSTAVSESARPLRRRSHP